MKLRLGPDAPDRIAENWLYRCMIEARRAYESTGGDDPMFLILQAAARLIPTKFPYYEQFAVKDENSQIRTNIYLSATDRDTGARICSAEDLKDNLMRLATSIKLPDKHIVALYRLVAAWVSYDDTEGQDHLAHERLPDVKPLVH